LAVYADLSWSPGGGLKVIPGLRLDLDPFAARPEAVLDPRLVALWTLGEGLVLKGGAGLYSQPPQPFQRIETFGNPELPWERAAHYALGAEWRALSWLQLELELFYQDRFRLAARSPRLVERGGEVVRENFWDQGQGRAYGLELQAKLVELRGLTGWLSYTLSRAEQRSSPEQAWRLFSLDQTHSLVALASWELGGGWAVGASARLTTGAPTTAIAGAIYDADADTYVPIPGETGGGPRGPTFFSLDLRVDRRFTFELWSLALYLDLMNATNHPNEEGRTYSFDYRESTPLPGLPIFPSFGVKGEF